MGYYSELLFTFYPAEMGDTSVSSWVEQHWPKANCEIEDADGMMIIRYGYVKWYEDYDFVQAAVAATVAFDAEFSTDSEEAKAHWEMMKVGDDDADIERDGSPFHQYRLSINREILVN